MKPILYAKTATDYSGSGQGTLNETITASVTEKRNGGYEAKFIYPLNGALFSSIGYDSIVKLKPCDGGSAQPFRVYRISKPINGKVTYNCEHISYHLNKKIVPAISLTGKTAVEIYSACAAAAVDTCSYSFTADGISGTEDYVIGGCKSMREVVFDLVELFGGELEWGISGVTLHSARGTDSGASIAHGENMTDVQYEGDTTSLYTAIYPYSGSVRLTERILTSTTHSNYAYERVLPVDFSDSFEGTPTETALRTAAAAYLANSGQFTVQENIKASFIPLNKTTEYASTSVPNVKLCDLVTVSHPTLGINKKAKIIALTYNVLAERPESVELGTKRSDLSNLSDSMSELRKEVAAEIAKLKETGDGAVRGYYSGDSAATIDAVKHISIGMTPASVFVYPTSARDGQPVAYVFLQEGGFTSPSTSTEAIGIESGGFWVRNTDIRIPNQLDTLYYFTAAKQTGEVCYG